jgi:hypothetical protein
MFLSLAFGVSRYKYARRRRERKEKVSRFFAFIVCSIFVVAAVARNSSTSLYDTSVSSRFSNDTIPIRSILRDRRRLDVILIALLLRCAWFLGEAFDDE